MFSEIQPIVVWRLDSIMMNSLDRGFWRSCRQAWVIFQRHYTFPDAPKWVNLACALTRALPRIERDLLATLKSAAGCPLESCEIHLVLEVLSWWIHCKTKVSMKLNLGFDLSKLHSRAMRININFKHPVFLNTYQSRAYFSFHWNLTARLGIGPVKQKALNVYWIGDAINSPTLPLPQPRGLELYWHSTEPLEQCQQYSSQLYTSLPVDLHWQCGMAYHHCQIASPLRKWWYFAMSTCNYQI